MATASKHHKHLKPKTKAKKLKTTRPPRDQLNVDHLRLKGDDKHKKLTADVRRSITAADLEMTLDGASTLTLKIHDPLRKLLNSDLTLEATTMIVDELEYTLAKVSHNGDEIDLIFEESAVHWLRQYSKPKKANRANTTRAQFIQGMVKEVKEVIIPWHCPEVNIKQPIAASAAGVSSGGGGGGSVSDAGGKGYWEVPASAEDDPPGIQAAFGPLPMDRRGYSVLSKSGMSSDAGTAGQAITPYLQGGERMNIVNPANGRNVTVPLVDRGAGSDAIRPVVGLYPQTRSDLGLSGGSFTVRIKRANGQSMRCERGHLIS